MNHNQIPNHNSSNDNAWENFQPDNFDPEVAANLRANAMPIQTPESAAENTAANYAERTRQNRLRQKSKVMRAILFGPDTLDPHNATPPRELLPTEQQLVYNLFSNGQISPKYESNFLQRLAPPIGRHGEKSAQVLNSLNTKQTRRILANFSGRGFENWNSVDSSDLQSMLIAYPTPIEFEPVAEQLLEQIRHQNSPAKAKTYADALTEFQQKFYGKRQEYHQAFSELRADALAAETAKHSVTNQYRSNAPSQTERANAEVFGPIENVGDQGGFVRHRLPLEPGQTPPPGSMPIREEESPLENSLHYMAPEVAARFDPRYLDSLEETSDTPKPPTKSGLFGKIFGRKK